MPDGENMNTKTFDYTDFGADAKTVRELYERGPAEVHQLVLRKREANAEAAMYREAMAKFGKVAGIDVTKYLSVHEQLANGTAKYNQLDEEQREYADAMLIDGTFEPNAIGAPADILDQIEAALNETDTPEGDDVNNTQEPAEMAEMKKRLAEAEAKAAEAELTVKLAEQGADPSQIAKLRKLAELPERSEDMDDETYQKAVGEYWENFKSDNSWGFGGKQSLPSAGNQQVDTNTRHDLRSQLEAAQKSGNYDEVVQLEKRIAAENKSYDPSVLAAAAQAMSGSGTTNTGE